MLKIASVYTKSKPIIYVKYYLAELSLLNTERDRLTHTSRVWLLDIENLKDDRVFIS